MMVHGGAEHTELATRRGGEGSELGKCCYQQINEFVQLRGMLVVSRFIFKCQFVAK